MQQDLSKARNYPKLSRGLGAGIFLYPKGGVDSFALGRVLPAVNLDDERPDFQVGDEKPGLTMCRAKGIFPHQGAGRTPRPLLLLLLLVNTQRIIFSVEGAGDWMNQSIGFDVAPEEKPGGPLRPSPGDDGPSLFASRQRGQTATDHDCLRSRPRSVLGGMSVTEACWLRQSLSDEGRGPGNPTCGFFPGGCSCKSESGGRTTYVGDV
jgi:hypothetical protein